MQYQCWLLREYFVYCIIKCQHQIKCNTRWTYQPGILPILFSGYSISLFFIICHNSNMKTVLKENKCRYNKINVDSDLSLFWQNNTFLPTFWVSIKEYIHPISIVTIVANRNKMKTKYHIKINKFDIAYIINKTTFLIALIFFYNILIVLIRHCILELKVIH
jgi:hypothetical protein